MSANNESTLSLNLEDAAGETPEGSSNNMEAANDEAQLNEASGVFDINYNDEFLRQLSYPDYFDFIFTSHLARNGFYYSSNTSARCRFCNEVITLVTPGFVVEPHDCDKTRNIQLRANTSDYRYEYNRILSFLRNNWPKLRNDTFHVGALDLSNWGFFSTGEAGVARCNFCRLEVRGWERGDSAEGMHRRINPHCPFLSGTAVGNISLGLENRAERMWFDVTLLNITTLAPSTTTRCLTAQDYRELDEREVVEEEVEFRSVHQDMM